MNFEISKFVAKVSSWIRCDQVSQQWHELWEDFERLESEFLLWEMEAFQEFAFVQVRQPEQIPDSYHSYLGFWSLSIWNKHRASRILLHQTLLEAFDAHQYSGPDSALETFNEEQCASSRSTIQEIADFVFASIPFSLGDVPLPTSIKGPKSVGGYFLVWTLQVILRCPFVSDGQRTHAKHALLRVGKQCGISYATIFAQKYGTSPPTPIPSSVQRCMKGFEGLQDQ